MSSKQIAVVLAAVVVLLVGISIGQYLRINDQAASIENLKADILAELDTKTMTRSHNSSLSGSSIAADSGGPGYTAMKMPPEPPLPLTDTQYWITTNYSDDRPFGYSAWIELVVGGVMMLEKCHAPVFAEVSMTAGEFPELIPKCSVLFNDKIASLDAAELQLSDGAVIPFEYIDNDDTRKLVLRLKGEKLVLEPGAKNALWEGLAFLPSVQAAFKQAFEAASQSQSDSH